MPADDAPAARSNSSVSPDIEKVVASCSSRQLTPSRRNTPASARVVQARAGARREGQVARGADLGGKARVHGLERGARVVADLELAELAVDEERAGREEQPLGALVVRDDVLPTGRDRRPGQPAVVRDLERGARDPRAVGVEDRGGQAGCGDRTRRRSWGRSSRRRRSSATRRRPGSATTRPGWPSARSPASRGGRRCPRPRSRRGTRWSSSRSPRRRGRPTGAEG